VVTILGIAGSLRRQSFNGALLRAAAELAPAGVQLEIASIEAIPLYNYDVEAAEGIPPAVAQLKDRIAATHGLLLATPEYNNAMPGVLKNAIDWLSRPPADIPRVFGGRPVALLGASPGLYGTVLSQNAWLPVLRTLRMRPWFDDRLLVPRANTVFDGEGRLIDEETRKRLEHFVAGFARFISAQSPTAQQV
jgi:chromate reductase, NAD(P)H dehydrogenase (quinone)